MRYSTEVAVRMLRADQRYADLVLNTYLDEDVVSAADRFEQSGEWSATKDILSARLKGAHVLDLGAGRGIATRAFLRCGVAHVQAVEPDESPEIGRGAIVKLCTDLPVSCVAAFAEELPVDSGSIDIVYARQVLHHTRDLAKSLVECARVLKPGGLFFACREHVADDAPELQAFLASHPVHQLTGEEHAYPLNEYIRAIASARLVPKRTLAPFDSVINLFPAVQRDEEIQSLPERRLQEYFGSLAGPILRLPGIRPLVWARIRRRRPGRLYSFLAQKP